MTSLSRLAPASRNSTEPAPPPRTGCRRVRKPSLSCATYNRCPAGALILYKWNGIDRFCARDAELAERENVYLLRLLGRGMRLQGTR